MSERSWSMALLGSALWAGAAFAGLSGFVSTPAQATATEQAPETALQSVVGPLEGLTEDTGSVARGAVPSLPVDPSAPDQVVVDWDDVIVKAPLTEAVKAYYINRWSEPVWRAGPNGSASAIERALQAGLAMAELEGLPAKDVLLINHMVPFESGIADPDATGSGQKTAGNPNVTPGALVRLNDDPFLDPVPLADIRRSLTHVLFAMDRLLGLTDRKSDKDLDRLAEEEGLSIAALLDGVVLAGQDDSTAISDLLPRSPQYLRLLAARAMYQHFVAKGGWPTDFPSGKSLEPGDVSDQMPKLRTRLALEGFPVRAPAAVSEDAAEDPDLSESSEAPAPPPPGTDPALVYDPGLVEAVKAFQTAHGYTDDGVIGPRTRAALNMSAQDKLDGIIAAMETWRRLPRDLGQTHFLVNVPQYQLFVNDGDQTALRMKVAVGSKKNQTPLFQDEIEYMEFNPYWNVPYSIALEEIIPKQVEDPTYLAERGYTVFVRGGDRVGVDKSIVDWEQVEDAARSYFLRQSPGPRNPLGTVKFMFPNTHSVYLHDTNSKRVFSRDFRAVSHGCIRVEQPEAVADFLLSRFTSRQDARYGDFKADHPKVVSLTEKVPVHLSYFTAWVEDDGSLRFGEDIYDRNGSVIKALQEALDARLGDTRVALID
ncbi:MAG: L,D-transpeptidase family protein [Rhodospirillaceae bacterium]